MENLEQDTGVGAGMGNPSLCPFGRLCLPNHVGQGEGLPWRQPRDRQAPGTLARDALLSPPSPSPQLHGDTQTQLQQCM